MKRVTYAVQITLDKATWVREEIGPPIGAGGKKAIEHMLRRGEAKILEPLMGWGPATHTVHVPEYGEHFHVRIEEP